MITQVLRSSESTLCNTQPSYVKKKKESDDDGETTRYAPVPKLERSSGTFYYFFKVLTPISEWKDRCLATN